MNGVAGPSHHGACGIGSHDLHRRRLELRCVHRPGVLLGFPLNVVFARHKVHATVLMIYIVGGHSDRQDFRIAFLVQGINVVVIPMRHAKIVSDVPFALGRLAVI